MALPDPLTGRLNAPAGSGRSPTGGQTMRQGRAVAKVAPHRREAAGPYAAPKGICEGSSYPVGGWALLTKGHLHRSSVVLVLTAVLEIGG